ncbi:MAG TPA: M48 family metalloprotease [Steroidobacteraceae bacterium]|nr:M48 family metalloprotease [Steroidobacteraceae bacterium]
MHPRWLLAIALLCLAGCATNPVTGKQEVQMVSQGQEIQIGQQQYGPGRQSQGGDYVTDPLPTQYVQQVGARLAAVADRALPYEFVVLNNSELNAWALPGGKIAVNRGLLMELRNEAELAAVLAHEIVHAAARHGAQQLEQGQLMQIGAAVASVAAGAYGGSDLGQMVGQGAMLGAQLLQAKYSRDDELEADRYGMQYMKRVGYDLQAAVALQELFLRKFESGRDADRGSSLFASHPPSAQRVAGNQQTMTKLGGPGGDLGADRYQKAIAGLRKSAPAYAKADEAVALARKGNLDAARSLVDEAIRLQPRESRFHGLRGEIAMAAKDPREALGHFDKARQLDPGYFKPIVQAGMVQYDLGNKAAAEPLLTRSMQLLPTAPAAYYLGRLNEDRGNTNEAVKLYKLAAGSQSRYGTEAMARLTRLDLAQNPQTYLSIQPQIDNEGRVWLTVGNRTTLPIAGVTILVGVVDQTGRTVSGPDRVGTGRNAIPARKAVNLRTDLGPFQNSDVLRYVKWKVEGAQVQ